MENVVPSALLLAALAAGFLAGLAAAWVLRIIQARTARDLANELFRQSEDERDRQVDALMEQARNAFGSLSLQALSRSTDEFLKLAQSKLAAERDMSGKDLDQKKGLIDSQLQEMTKKLQDVSRLMGDLEKDRAHAYSQLATRMQEVSERTAALTQTTGSLREALSSSRVRGQWGERMAEDVLRVAGFVEDVNYRKQKTMEASGARPDFTFLLPRGLTLNMDVKFPYDNYMAFLEAENETEKDRFCKTFLKDVKQKIKEVTSREYIDPEHNTVDYVLLFIPNEQIYAFIHENDSSILDEGLRNRVIFCSPVTLYAVLAVIRQAVDNFALENTSNEILSLMGTFKKQWGEFLKKMEHMGKQIEATRNDYEALVTTRRRQLDKPLSRLEELRTMRNISSALLDEGEEPIEAEMEEEPCEPEEEPVQDSQ
ncbi:MAG: DNA recombination protein RmuC [Synergistota bacterium]|nr:DNA recombination protein RmuC [Synergistota bacterium]